MSSVYESFAAELAAEAARAARTSRPNRERDLYEFLSGEWRWHMTETSEVTPQSRRQSRTVRFEPTAYGIAADSGTGLLPFLIYEPKAEMWLLVAAAPDVYGILAGLGRSRNQSLFTGEWTVDQVPMRLRQRWSHDSDDSIRVITEEHVAGEWHRLDEGRYERRKL